MRSGTKLIKTMAKKNTKTPKKTTTIPQHIFEVSWEVCNRVGGIYAVLSTRAKSMVDSYGQENVVFIGPDCWTEQESPWFIENETNYNEFKAYTKDTFNLDIRVGNWDVPGNPTVILVKFEHLFPQKDTIYAEMWNKFGVNSLHGYGDYDESCMFAYASGQVIESYYKFYKSSTKTTVAHFNEWTVGMGALYVKDRLPSIATLFTTHATTVGRSIAGNNKPLYSHLHAYNGDQMAQELNVEAKHSIEKQAAHNVDCFTTVSDITATECSQLLDKTPFVTPNGFEQDFVPRNKAYDEKRQIARKKLIAVGSQLFGKEIKEDALLIATSGRYEYRNKGIDVFIDALSRLNNTPELEKEIIAFIMVPAWVKEVRTDLLDRLNSEQINTTPLPHPNITHWLHQMESDPILNQLNFLGLSKSDSKVKVIFIPSYLNGDDGLLNMTYYDLLIGLDTTIFPSYYEPWGYTPHESIAFSVPTITTFLAGFGVWASHLGNENGMEDGLEVIPRDDYNFIQVSERIREMLLEVAKMNKTKIKQIRKKASDKSKLGDWKHFFKHYEEAYALALESKNERFKTDFFK